MTRNQTTLSLAALLLLTACNQNKPTDTEAPTNAGATTPAAGAAAGGEPVAVQPVPPGVTPSPGTMPTPAATGAPPIMDGGTLSSEAQSQAGTGGAR